jgi:hypothetical protein
METEYEQYLESESESESEAAERRRPPARASGTNLYPPRLPTNGGVTQQQLRLAMARVGDQLKTNSAAVGTLNSRINTVGVSEKRDNERREKDLKSLNEKIQLLTLLPLLIKPTFTLPFTVNPAGQQVGSTAATNTTTTSTTVDTTKTTVGIQPDQASTLNALLPLLLIGGGLGTSSGSGGSGSSSDGGMDTGTLLILALILSGGLKP